MRLHRKFDVEPRNHLQTYPVSFFCIIQRRDIIYLLFSAFSRSSLANLYESLLSFEIFVQHSATFDKYWRVIMYISGTTGKEKSLQRASPVYEEKESLVGQDSASYIYRVIRTTYHFSRQPMGQIGGCPHLYA